MIGLPLIAIMAGCSSGDRVLSDLSGTWSGTVTAEAVPSTASADFAFVNDDYLDGTITILEPRGEQTYSVRRAEVFGKSVALSMQTIDLVYALALDGEVSEGTFTGTATLTTECGQERPCGWRGDFSLNQVGGPAPQDTAPPGTGTGTRTGTGTTTPEDTAPP